MTGGGSGIGRATAVRAAREGAAVAVVDRARDNAAETAAMIRGRRRRRVAYPCDVADDAAVADTVGDRARRPRAHLRRRHRGRHLPRPRPPARARGVGRRLHARAAREPRRHVRGDQARAPASRSTAAARSSRSRRPPRSAVTASARATPRARAASTRSRVCSRCSTARTACARTASARAVSTRR